MIWLLIGLAIGGALGAAWREIYSLKDVMKKPKIEVKTSGVVSPAYHPPSETKQSPTVVRPKTPQQMDWEASHRRNQEVLSNGRN
jgi:hypothetical protein